MSKELLQQALAYVRWQAFGKCRTVGWPGPIPTAAELDAALVAAIAQPVPLGYKLVPVKPTVEMSENGSIASDYDLSQNRANAVWRAMLAAAPDADAQTCHDALFGEQK